jgi:ABC-2 type transport system ATP-binding protein
MDAALDVHGLTKSFRRHSVLANLDLQVKFGAAIGLLGANGSGKTTLLKILLGLLEADNGTSLILGESPRELSAEARTKIAYVPQTPNQFFWLSGRAMLKYIAAFYPSFDWDYAKDLSDRWKVSLRTPISVLSPGQQQRLSIVRALATRPELLELIRLRAERRLTLLVSSHITGDLERLCTDFAILEGGRIAAMASIDSLRQLVRTSLEGDETTLARLSFDGCRHVRKPKDGERMVLTDEAASRLVRESLPDTVRATTQTSDLETVFSEWMQ